jgi:hypothetical protein
MQTLYRMYPHSKNIFYLSFQTNKQATHQIRAREAGEMARYAVARAKEKNGRATNAQIFLDWLVHIQAILRYNFIRTFFRNILLLLRQRQNRYA